MPTETWKKYGSWRPTAELRLRSGKLEQVWQRDYETAHHGGIVVGGDGCEKEWREVPSVE